MDDVVQAISIAFACIVFVIALSVSMYMFSQVTTTAEALSLYADPTTYYDNVQLVEDNNGENGTERLVSAETIIPTLYRYHKENFCVKIYDASNNLIQIFDVKLEGDVHNAVADTNAEDENDSSQVVNNALKNIFDDKEKPYYLFQAPWLGSTEAVKTRIDFFINGDFGYINNALVDYRKNKFYAARMQGIQFREQFISYSYTGETMETEDGDTLVTGAESKDKIVIIYTMLENPAEISE